VASVDAISVASRVSEETMKKPQRRPADSDAVNNLSRVLTELTQCLVDTPREVSVKTATESRTTEFLLHVAPKDWGRVIGKNGRTVNALRVILDVASTKLNHRFSLDLDEAAATQQSGADANKLSVQEQSKHGSAQTPPICTSTK